MSPKGRIADLQKKKEEEIARDGKRVLRYAYGALFSAIVFIVTGIWTFLTYFVNQQSVHVALIVFVALSLGSAIYCGMTSLTQWKSLSKKLEKLQPAKK